MGSLSIEPGAGGWEAWTLPLSYTAPPLRKGLDRADAERGEYMLFVFGFVLQQSDSNPGLLGRKRECNHWAKLSPYPRKLQKFNVCQIGLLPRKELMCNKKAWDQISEAECIFTLKQRSYLHFSNNNSATKLQILCFDSDQIKLTKMLLSCQNLKINLWASKRR